MKTLYIISKGINKPSDEEIRRLEAERKVPRWTLLEDVLNADLLDERYLMEKPPAIRKLLYKYLPTHFSQIIEALFIQNRYNAILSQSEKVGLPLALVMKYLGMKTPHSLIISRITSVYEKRTKRKMWFFNKTKDTISRYLIWSSNQRNIAINEIGINPERIILIKRGTDQLFWKQDSNDQNMICSVGMEARDYPTLVEAMREVDIPIHIAAGQSRGELFETVKKLYDIDNVPDNVTIGEKTLFELRDLYAKSRFSVVSLMPTDSDNGLTAILESMSMGKPVICTKAEGQIDVIRDGETGIMIPQGDPLAMREAILDLWNNPDKCREMGKKAQEYVDTYHNMEQFAEAIKREVEATVQETKGFSKIVGKHESAETVQAV
ncbi:MAG: glycosyltransferase family 4 protein [Balneolia bacterium]|nr:glycosyltransferase family 4 protein [Balneolia bacterium]